MAKTEPVEVRGCADCPFMRSETGRGGYCTIHPQRIDVSENVDEAGTLSGQLDGVPNFPPGCPLKARARLVSLRHVKAKAGRPMPAVTPGRDLEAELRHFWEWVEKAVGYAPSNRTKGSTACPPSRVVAANPELSISHLRAALQRRRPFYEAEFDAVVKWAKLNTKYTGFLPPEPKADEPISPLFTL